MFSISFLDMIIVAFPEPVVPYFKKFYELLHLLLMLLLLILMASTYSWPTVWIHSSSAANRLSLTFQKVYQEIYPTVLFWMAKFLINLHQPVTLKAFPRLKTCSSINSKLCRKLVLLSYFLIILVLCQFYFYFFIYNFTLTLW